MSDLNDLLGSSSEVDSFKAKQKAIEEIEKTANPSDVRKKEIEIFQPKDVLTFMKYSDVNQYFDYVKLFFANKEYYLLFRKYFKVSEYLEPNCHYLEPIVALLVAMERGNVKIEVEGDFISLKCEKPFEIRVQKG